MTNAEKYGYKIAVTISPNTGDGEILIASYFDAVWIRQGLIKEVLSLMNNPSRYFRMDTDYTLLHITGFSKDSSLWLSVKMEKYF